MLRILLVLLAGLVALLLAVVALAWRFQERIVWQPPAGWRGDDRWPLEEGVRRVTYRAADGQPLVGYLVAPPPEAAAAEAAPGRVLLAFHGNAELAEDAIPWATRVAIVRRLLGLEETIGMTVVGTVPPS